MHTELDQYRLECQDAALEDRYTDADYESLGDYDARTGEYPRSAIEAYLRGYCAAIKAISNPKTFDVKRPGVYTFLTDDNEQLSF